MSTSESIFLEAWKAGIELSVNGERLHYRAESKPSETLLKKLKDHKPALIGFLSHWIQTPYGEGKIWGFLKKRRCGVVLRKKPDRVTWIKRSEWMMEPAEKGGDVAVPVGQVGGGN